MSIVVIGPSSVGKSTLLQTNILDKYSDVVFGYELKTTPVREDTVIHYNLFMQGLHRYRRLFFRTNQQRWNNINQYWDFDAEPIFAKILHSGMIERWVVLVAPIQELIERIEAREIREKPDETNYPSSFWSQAVNNLQVYRIYEQLFDILDQGDVPYDVYYSSETVNGFAPTDRVYVHANLKGAFSALPDKTHVEAIASDPRCQYQTVRLPYGIVTNVRNYQHLPKERDTILKNLLPKDVAGDSILDVGSAMGALLFLAERMGAGRMVGIELDEDRHAASQMLATLLQSQAEFHHVDFLDYDEPVHFDHVFSLNVIHHVHNFYDFIRKMAQACLKTFTLEFPTLTDEKFAQLHKLSQDELATLDKLPLIGVSGSKGAGQSFVYSPKAIIHLIMTEIGGFERYEVKESAFKGRVIVVFYRKRK